MWIWENDKLNINEFVEFKKPFCINKIDDKNYIKISVTGEYVLFINGNFIGFGQYHSYPKKRAYDLIEINKDFLRCGENELYIGVYNMGETISWYIKSQGCLFYEMKIGDMTICSTVGDLCRINNNYKNGDIEMTTPQIGYVFSYDSNRIKNDWKKSVEIPNDTTLFQRPIKKLNILGCKDAKIITQGYFIRNCTNPCIADCMQTDYMSFVNGDKLFENHENLSLPSETGITVNSSNNFYIIIDLGEECAGQLKLDVSCGGGTVFDISNGEHLDDGRVRAKIGARNFANRYVAKEGRQSFIHYYSRLAGRYLQINVSNVSANVTIYYAGILQVEYPLLNIKPSPIKNRLHEALYDAGIRTLKLCMHEHYEDCPWREQALYAMDSRNQALCGYFAFSEYDFPKASITLLGDGLNKDGFLQITAPTDMDFTIPIFSFMWIVELAEYTKYSGDISLAQDFSDTVYTIIKRALVGYQNGIAKTPHGKQYWNFYEWMPELSGTLGQCEDNQDRLDAPYQLFLIFAMQNSLEIGIGKGIFEDYITEMKKAFNDTFWDENKGWYCSFLQKNKKYHYCELVQSLAVCTSVCGTKENAIIEKLAKQNDLIEISLSHYLFKFEALMKNNYKDEVLSIIEDKWGSMLFSGATTFWETSVGADDFDYAGSLCHGWSAIIVYIYHKYFTN